MMSRVSHIVLTFIIIMFAQRSHASEAFTTADSVTLTISIVDAHSKEQLAKLSITTYSDFIGNYGQENNNRVAIQKFNCRDGDKLKIRIPAPSNIFWLQISYHPGDDPYTISLYAPNKVYYMENTDNLNCILGPTDIHFSGIGSEKMNLQRELFRYDFPESPELEKLQIEERKSKKVGAYYQLRTIVDKGLDSLYDIKVNLLQKYKPLVNSTIFYALENESIAIRRKATLKGLRLILESEVEDNASNEAEMYFLDHIEQLKPKIKKPILPLSYSYLDNIYDFERISAHIKNKGKEAISFDKALFKEIIEKYGKITRDKLLLKWFAYAVRNGLDVSPYFEEALKNIYDPVDSATIVSIKSKMMTGEPFFRFDLKDNLGRSITLQSLKGKVILVDFWFTGCGPCRIMASNLEPVMNHFAKDDHVIFLSVSVSSKSWWLKGIKSRQYTASAQLLTYTNDMGYNHPLIRYYNIQSYPKLMLIDKFGNLASFEPPNPTNKNGKNQLIIAIEKLL